MTATDSAGSGERAIAARRSIRRYRPEPVDTTVLRRLVAAACHAPAPHHARPWRFVIITGIDSKASLAEVMAAAWSKDLESDGTPADRVRELTDGSISRISGAPALILACINRETIRESRDDRAGQEWTMACFSLGAAVENLLLAASDQGLGACWLAAPLYCPDAVRETLDLPAGWVPQALVTLGAPDPEYAPPERPPIDDDDFTLLR